MNNDIDQTIFEDAKVCAANVDNKDSYWLFTNIGLENFVKRTKARTNKSDEQTSQAVREFAEKAAQECLYIAEKHSPIENAICAAQDCAFAIRALLDGQAQSSDVPEGWILVPIEPTDAMTYAGQSLRYDSSNSIGAIYRAMIAALSNPTQEKANGG